MPARQLPPYVYLSKRGRYEYKPYTPGDGRKRRRPTFFLRGADGKALRTGVPLSAVWAAWEQLQGAPRDTIGWLLDAYLASPRFSALASDSQQKERERARTLKRVELQGGRLFADAQLKTLTPGVFRRYLDMRARQGSPVGGNRDVRLISTAWNWALERDLLRLPNPTQSVKRNPEAARERYVTDEEYRRAHELALAASSYAYLPSMMEVAYLCRMRRGEVLGLKRSDITDAGLQVRRAKGSRNALTYWSPRLRAAIDRALALHGTVVSPYVFHDKRGQPIKPPAFNSAWRRLQARLKEEGGEPFTFHDLKAKGVSDFDGNKQTASGHKTARMVSIYDRKTPEIEPTR